MPAKVSSLVVVVTYADGRTTTTVFPEPEKIETEVETLQLGELHATSLYAFDNSKVQTTINIISGDRGQVTVVTPVTGD